MGLKILLFVAILTFSGILGFWNAISYSVLSFNENNMNQGFFFLFFLQMNWIEERWGQSGLEIRNPAKTEA